MMIGKRLHQNQNASQSRSAAMTVRFSWLERVAAATKAEDCVRSMPDPPQRILRATVDRIVYRALVDIADQCAEAGIPMVALREAFAEASEDLAALVPPLTTASLASLREDDAITTAQTICEIQRCRPCAYLGREEYCSHIQAAMCERLEAIAEDERAALALPHTALVPCVVTKRGLTAVWESGGINSHNNGEAVLVAHPDGAPKVPIFIKYHPDLNGDHALFVVDRGDLVALAVRSGDDLAVGVYEITGFADDAVAVTARCRMLNNDWDRTPMPYLLPLIRAIKEKMECRNCGRAFFMIDS